MKKIIAATALVLALTFGFASVTCGETRNSETMSLIDEDEKDGHKIVYSMMYSAYTANDLKYFMVDTRDLEKGDTWHLYINTGGGDAFSTVGLVNHIDMLKAKGVRIVTEARGAVMSAGAIAFMCGQERIAAAGDTFMFHSVAMGYGVDHPSKAKNRHQKWLMMHLNHWLRQKFLDITNDTEVTNKLLKYSDDGNMNWFTSAELAELGIVTTLQGENIDE